MTCDQCTKNETDSRCPACKLWTCMDCFTCDHVWCHGPFDPWLGAFRVRAQQRAKEPDAGPVNAERCRRCATGEGVHEDAGYCASTATVTITRERT